MASLSPSFLLLLRLLLLLLSSCLASPAAAAERRLHVVYMGEKHHADPDALTALHHTTLSSLLRSKEAALEAMVYSYRHGFSGFAAMLTDDEAELLSEEPGVVGVKLSGDVRTHTTRSWDFVGLTSGDGSNSLLNAGNSGRDIIVGVVDSGIWPEARSFIDEGYGPVPERWRGTCQTGQSFTSAHCNRKIIGARYYTAGIARSVLESEYESPRDKSGHGTHSASTIAGSLVANASFRGLGAGTARGAAPMARLAVYKVLWGEPDASGNDAAVLKAIDDAVADGVDVLSLSLSSELASWASLHAVKKGIPVVFSGGNDGPTPRSVVNDSPWVVTVAATTLDRSFPTAVTLGNNQSFLGQAFFFRFSSLYDQFLDIIDGDTCDSEAEKSGRFNKTAAAGKIVLCTMGRKQPDAQFLTAVRSVVAEGQGAGVIYAQYATHKLEALPVPCVKVDFEAHEQMLQYIASTRSPMVRVSATTPVQGNGVLAPVVASFSSRGPSKMFPEILKPDVAAPGVNILAAEKDGFKFRWGSSVSASEVSGVVALIKAVRPRWSPAAIKSALVTTALTMDTGGLPMLAEGVPRKMADPFDYGGGFMNPNRAVDPGLVYDIDPQEYDEFRCTLDGLVVCQTPRNRVYHLNLPSISIPDLKSEVRVVRTVANVGPVMSSYRLSLESPPGVDVLVEPSVLVFDGRTSWNRFAVTFRARRKVQGAYSFGSLTWFNDRYRVRIPIAVRTVILDSFSDSG